jgi:hypothetical protein
MHKSRKLAPGATTLSLFMAGAMNIAAAADTIKVGVLL